MLASIMLVSLSTVFAAGSAQAAFASNVNLDETVENNVFGTDDWKRTVTISGVENGNFYAGAFDVTDTVTGTGYMAFCFELDQNLSLPTDYAVNQTAPSTAVGGLLNNLFTNSFSEVVDATSAAAFQVAIWEIVYDSGNLGLSSGTFMASAPSDVLMAAGDFLMDLAGTSSDYNLSFFRSDSSQDLILWEDNLSNNEASAPATSILIALSLGGLVLVRRKLA